MQRTLSCPFFRKAFGWCVPIGGLAIAYAPTGLLKLLLGAVLIAAAGKTLTSQP